MNRSVRLACLMSLVAGSLASMANAQVVTLESKQGVGAGATGQGDGHSDNPVISPDGTKLLLISQSTNFNDGSSGQGGTRIIRRDRVTGTMNMVNGGVPENPPLSGLRVMNGSSFEIAYRGGSVIFTNNANQGGGTDPCVDNNNFDDLYLNGSGVPNLTSATGGFCGIQGNGDSGHAAISRDGLSAIFHSVSTTFTASDTAVSDVFVVNLTGTKTFSKKSVTGNIISGITAGNGNSTNPDAGGGTDGNDSVWVFESDATNLGGTNVLGFKDIYARIEPSGVGFPFTQRISVSSTGGEPNGSSFTPSISANGNMIAFSSAASNLLAGDTNGFRDIYLYTRSTNTMRRMSIARNGNQPNADCLNPKVSGDGQWVVFESAATNLIANRTFPVGITNVYLVHIATGTITVCSYDFANDAFAGANSTAPTINDDGSVIAFESSATNLVPGDVGGHRDIFTFERSASPANDDCTNAIGLGLFPFTQVGNTSGATVQPGLPPFCGQAEHSPDVWYRFTATCSGQYSFDTEGSDFDTVLTAFESCGGDFLSCNDDFAAPARWSKITLNLTAGQSIHLRVAGFQGKVGNFVLAARFVGGPANDSCSNAITIGLGNTPFQSCGATTDGPALFNCQGASNAFNDIWYSFTAPASGVYRADICDANYDSVLSVYNTGACPVNTLQQMACNDDICGVQSRFTFLATANQQYLIRVGAYHTGNGGSGNLSLALIGCSPADIADDQGNPLPPAPGVGNTGVNEGDYNAFFQGFFDAAEYCDIADDQGTPLPPYGNPIGANTGVNEGDYNCFFQFFFNGCP